MILNNTHKQGWGYFNLTGQFPQTSAWRNKYIFLFLSWDTNAILMEPMQNKNDNEMLQVYRQVYDKHEKVGIKSKINIMENEASLHACRFITNTLHATYQKVAPHSHCMNAAIKAIQTAKHHCISNLSSIDSHFLKHQWDDPQPEFTFNMLQPMRTKPKILAHTCLFGEHNYNAAPLAPPGSKFLCHDDPTECQTWSPHGAA